jgi:Endoplasmic Reticulum Oxidoreductin 1 (ERO1)
MMRLLAILLPLSILQLSSLRTSEGFLSPSPVKKGKNGRLLLSTATTWSRPQRQQLPTPTTTSFNNRHGSSLPCLLFSTISSFNNQNQEYLMPGIAAIDARNDEILSKLEKLRTSPYFRFFSVDILASCEYIPQELVECYTESCEIYPADEDKVCNVLLYYCDICDILFHCMVRV